MNRKNTGAWRYGKYVSGAISAARYAKQAHSAYRNVSAAYRALRDRKQKFQKKKKQSRKPRTVVITADSRAEIGVKIAKKAMKITSRNAKYLNRRRLNKKAFRLGGQGLNIPRNKQNQILLATGLASSDIKTYLLGQASGGITGSGTEQHVLLKSAKVRTYVKNASFIPLHCEVMMFMCKQTDDGTASSIYTSGSNSVLQRFVNGTAFRGDDYQTVGVPVNGYDDVKAGWSLLQSRKIILNPGVETLIDCNIGYNKVIKMSDVYNLQSAGYYNSVVKGVTFEMVINCYGGLTFDKDNISKDHVGHGTSQLIFDTAIEYFWKQDVLDIPIKDFTDSTYTITNVEETVLQDYMAEVDNPDIN